MRNILLELSFDDFPPFEQKAQHSFGIVSAVPQNLSTGDKIQKRFVWPIIFIPGPKAPIRLNEILASFTNELNDAYNNGIKVYDSLTNTDIVVFVGPGTCSCDLPASERIGGFLGSSAFHGCKYCFYRASVCLHTTDPATTITELPSWHNSTAVVNQSVLPPKITRTSSATIRKMKSGEHKCWADTKFPIPKHMLKTDKYVRRAQKKVSTLPKKEINAARLQLYLVSHPCCFSKFDSHCFPLPDSFALDFMHMLLERIAGRTLKILFSDNKFGIHQQAIQRYDQAIKPAWVKSKLPPNLLHVSWWTAAQRFEFVKHYFCLVIDGLVEETVLRCVSQLCRLVTSLSCLVLPRDWVQKKLAQRGQHRERAINPENLDSTTKKLKSAHV